MLPTDYKDIGHYLRDSRESLRVSREQAAHALHIRAKYLEALETGNLAELPGKTYTRGYIRNYAQYLHLNVDEVLDAYAPILGPRTQELFIPEPTLRQNLPTRSLVWLSLAGLVLVYTYWYREFYDHAAHGKTVADLPPSFARLLDKPTPTGMDKAWDECISGTDNGCIITLRMHARPLTKILYGIDYKTRDTRAAPATHEAPEKDDKDD